MKLKIIRLFSFLLICSVAYIIFFRLTQNKIVQADSLLKFDEGYGTSIHDSSASAVGTITGATWKTEDLCYEEKCLFFDGSDWISFGDDASYDFAAANDFTIEFWFRHGIASATEVIIQKYEGTGADGGYRVQMESDGDISFGVDDANGGFADDNITSTAATYDDNKWHYVTAVKDGTTGIYLYIDTILVASDTSIGSTGNLTNDDTFYIGDSLGADGGDEYIGFLDEVKIYVTSARSASEVKSDYLQSNPDRGTSASFGPDQSYLSDGLLGYWKMDESSGNAADSSGNQATLTNNNSTTFTSGKFGNSGNFVAASSQSFTTNSSSTNLSSTSFTITSWVYLTDKPSSAYVFYSKGGGQGTWSYRLQYNGTASDDRFYFWTTTGGAGGTSQSVTANTFGSPSAGTWYFIVGTYDVGAKKISISVNNGPIDQSDTSGGYAYNSASDFSIGCTSSPSSLCLNGKVDETRIYNRVLSPAEAEDLYNWGPGPVGHWKMDENTGTTAEDYSGNSNTATLYNGPSYSPGKFGSALYFDGASGKAQNDYVQINAGDSLDYLREMTYSGWIYPVSTGEGGGGRIIQFDNTDTLNCNGYYVWTGNKIGFFYGWSGSTSYFASWYTQDNSITLNQWNHVAITYNATSTSNDPIIYINGIPQILTETQAPLGTAGTTSHTSVYIGNRRISGPDYDRTFDGLLDDSKIYNYARTPGQIIEDMNAGHPAPGSPVGSYVARWKMDDGVGVTANDTTSNNNDLTLSAASWTPTGKFSGAWNGDGAKWLAKADDADFDFAASEDFSISLWAKSDSASLPGATEVLINKHVATNNPGYRLSFNTSGQVVCEIDDDTSSFPEDTAQSTTNYYDAAWHQIICVRDITGDDLNLYVDGKFVDDDGNLDATGSLENADNLSIGDEDESDDGDEFFGDIDEVKIFRSALTADQVKADFNFGSAQTMGNVADQDEQGFSITDPVGWWKIDEGTGTTSTTDYSGSVNDLTMNNFESTDWAQYYRFAHQSYALTLDGTNEHLSRSDDADFDFGTAAFSLSAWVRHPATSTADYIFAKTDATNGGYKLYQDSSGEFCFAIDDDSSWTPDFSLCSDAADGVEYDDNTWHHVAGVRVSTTEHRLYVDGKNVAANAFSVGSTISNTGSLYVGMDSDGSTGGWDGQIDDARIYNYALSRSQMAYLFNRSAPFAWYKFDECSGSTANNSALITSGADVGYDGTITIGAGGSEDTVGDCSTSSTAWGNGAIGKYNSSLDFDGTDDYVDIGEATTTTFEPGSGTFTIEAWVNRDTFNTLDVITAKKDDASALSATGWVLAIQPGDGILFNIGNGSQSNFALSASPNTITSSGWNHIVGTYLGGGTGTSYIYLNGKLVATGSGSPGNFDNSLTVRIGSESDGGQPFDGKIDEVKFYNSYFTAQQVLVLYNQGRAVRFGPATGSP